MPARTRTLAQLRSDVQYAADIAEQSARHPDAKLDRLINESWQRLRMLVSDNGNQAYLKPASGTLSIGATSPYAFGTLSLPADLVSLYAFDVTVSARDIRSVDVVPFSERNEWRSTFGTNTGIPVACHIYNVGTESSTSVDVGKLAIHPAPDRAYAYTLWYLPSWVDVASDLDVFDGVAGWEEWVVHDCVCKIAERDNDMAQTYQIAQNERRLAEERILKAANSLQRIGPSTRVDAAVRSRANARSEYWRRP